MYEFTQKEIIDLLQSLSRIEGFLIANAEKRSDIDDLLSSPMAILTKKLTNDG